MNISIFAKKPFRARSDGHWQRVSSVIRGWQIAEQIGAKLNPESGYENDLCIYVKPHVPPSYVNVNVYEGKKKYLDIIDGWGLLTTLQANPDLGVIACSQTDADTLIRGVGNDVIFIPQHHCNFEREKRSRNELTTVGVIGTKWAFQWLPAGLKDELAERGMELIEFSEFYSRQDIVDFYKKIDIQIVWRPYRKKLANPLKLVNAASFGIPTIALDEPYFHELKGYYFPVGNIENFLARLDELKANPGVYTDYSDRCFRRAEEYHIENVGKMYKNLAI